MSAWNERQERWKLVNADGREYRIGDTVYDAKGKRFANYYGITQEPTGGSEGMVLLSPGSGGLHVDRQELYPWTYGLRIVPAGEHDTPLG